MGDLRACGAYRQERGALTGRGVYRQERGALTGCGAHRAYPPLEIITSTAHSERASHWALRATHRGITPRNYPIRPKSSWMLIKLEGRKPTSTFASNLKGIAWFYDYKSNANFFIKQTKEDIKKTMMLGFVL